MKFVYQLLIFLLIFSVMLGLFSQFFPGTDNLIETPHNPISSENNLREYEGIGGGISIVRSMFLNVNTFVVFGAIFGIGGLLSRFAGGSVNIVILLGVSIFIATLTAAWTFAVNTISNLNYNNNPEVTTIFIIVNICIGILAIFTVVDLLTGQQGVETG